MTAPPLDWPPVRNVIVAPIVALVAISAELLLLTPAEVPGAQEHPPQVAESEPANRAETITALSLRPSADLAAEIVGLQTKLNLAQANELSWRQKAEYYQNRQQQTSTSKPEEREKAIAALTTQPSEKLATQIVDLQGKLGSTQRMEAYWKQQFDYYDKRWQHAALSWSLIPAVPINLTDRPVRGPADAVHTMVIFTDFQCPHCKKFEDFVHNTVIPLSQSRGGMKVVFRHWPICQDCNTHAGTNLHPLACQASLAAEAARIVGGNEAFWKMHDLLWARQSEWRRTRDFAALAREISLDVAAFTRAMDSDEAMKRVKADIEEGVNLGKNVEGIRAQDLEVIKVDSTPSVFVDNKRLWRLGQHPSFWGTILESRPRAMPAERPASARQEGMGPTAPPRGVSSRPTQ